MLDGFYFFCAGKSILKCFSSIVFVKFPRAYSSGSHPFLGYDTYYVSINTKFCLRHTDILAYSGGKQLHVITLGQS